MDIIEKIRKQYDLGNDVKSRITSSKNIAFSKNGKDILVCSKKGKKLNGIINETFTEKRINEIKKKVKQDYFKIDLKVSKKHLKVTIEANRKFFDFTKITKDFNCNDKNIVKGIKQAYSSNISIKKDIKKGINKRLAEISYPSQLGAEPLVKFIQEGVVYARLIDGDLYFCSHSHKLPCRYFITRGGLKKRFEEIETLLKALEKKAKILDKFAAFKNKTKERMTYRETKSEYAITGKHKITGAEIEFRLDEPYRKKVNDFIKEQGLIEKEEFGDAIEKLGKAHIYGNVLAAAICSILSSGIDGTEQIIIKLLRGLTVSNEFAGWSEEKIKDNPFVGKFKDIHPTDISEMLERLRTKNVIEKRKVNKTYGNFQAFTSTRLTPLIANYVKEDINSLDEVLEDPASYYFFASVKDKMKNLSNLEKKYLKVLQMLEDNETKKKLIQKLLKEKK